MRVTITTSVDGELKEKANKIIRESDNLTFSKIIEDCLKNLVNEHESK